MRFPKIQQEKIGAEIGPRDGALPGLALLVKRLKPAQTIALAIQRLAHGRAFDPAFA